MERKNKINTLQELRHMAEDTVVDRIITEYLMELVAKAKTLEQVQMTVEQGGSLDDIKKLL